MIRWSGRGRPVPELEEWARESYPFLEGLVGIEVEVNDNVVPPDPRGEPTFRQPGIDIFATDDGLLVHDVAGAAQAVIRRGQPSASVVLSTAALDSLRLTTTTFLATVVILTARRVGHYHLHCAALVTPRGRGVLIVGDAHSGKSTTSALLAKQGWLLASDDSMFCVRHESHTKLLAALQPLALRRDVWELIGDRVGVESPERGKYVMSSSDLRATRTDAIVPHTLLVTAFGEKESSVAPIAKEQAFGVLLRSSAWFVVEPELADEHLDVLETLLRQCDPYRLTLAPDILTEPGSLLQILDGEEIS